MSLHRTEPSSPAKTPPVSRRSVVNAALWSTPVIAVAVAAPAASASDVPAFDAELAGLQMGATMRMFTADLTAMYDVDTPMGFTLLNHGPAAIPAGTTATVSYDSRMHAPSEFSVRMGGVTVPITPGPPVANGNSATITFTIPLEIQPNSDIFDPAAVRVLTYFDWLGVYPNDHLDNNVPNRHAVIINDANPANNELGGSATPTFRPAEPWGISIDRVWEAHTWNGGTCTADLAARATVTSVGPQPTRVGDQIMVNYDTRIAESATPVSVTLNGTPAPGLLTVAEVSATGLLGYTYLSVNQALAANDIVAFELNYTMAPDAGSLSDISRSGLLWWPVDHLNDPNDRQCDTVEDSYNQNSSCTL